MREQWFHKNIEIIKPAMRAIFGFVWLIDGALKFQAGMPNAIAQMILVTGQGQPAWLQPWFSFWFGIISPNPAPWIYFIGACEVLLGLALIFGFMRKITYALGIVLSLFIWAVPEGFGGPYGPSSTDIGTGIIYALAFFMLMIINAGYGPSKLSIDHWLERRIRWWRRLAEFE